MLCMSLCGCVCVRMCALGPLLFVVLHLGTTTMRSPLGPQAGTTPVKLPSLPHSSRMVSDQGH